jgi:hypothetical protein
MKIDLIKGDVSRSRLWLTQLETLWQAGCWTKLDFTDSSEPSWELPLPDSTCTVQPDGSLVLVELQSKRAALLLPLRLSQ